jgi:hypothetical protein
MLKRSFPCSLAIIAIMIATAGTSRAAISIINGDADSSWQAGGPSYMQPDAGDAYSNTNPAAGLLVDGWKTWASSSNGGNVRLWNPGPTDRTAPANNQFFDTSWGGLDASGDADGGVIAVRTQAYDYVNYSGTTGPWDSFGNRLWNINDNDTGDGDPTAANYSWRQDSGGVWDGVSLSWTGGVRDFEAAAQILSDTFDRTSRYELTVQVGRLAEGSGPSYDGSGLNAGANTATGGTSTRFANDAPAQWGGYTVDLMAGGVEGQTSQFGGWVYGTTANPADADYIGMVAQDNNTLALAQDSWGTSSVSYLPSPGSATDLDGKNLVIRLSALELVGNHIETTVAAFDDVVLVRYLAGDANLDGDVDVFQFDGNGDAQILTSNLGTPSGADWGDGDFNGDGDVDVFQFDGGGDAQLLTSNIGLTADVGADQGVGQAEALYNPATGELFFDVGAGVGVIGLQGPLNHAAVDNGSIFGIPAQNVGGILAYFNAAGIPTGEDSVGLVLPLGLDAGDLLFSYTPIGGTTTQVPVFIIGGVIPEPSTMVLLGMGCLGLVGLRRRR